LSALSFRFLKLLGGSLYIIHILLLYICTDKWKDCTDAG